MLRWFIFVDDKIDLVEVREARFFYCYYVFFLIIGKYFLGDNLVKREYFVFCIFFIKGFY